MQCRVIYGRLRMTGGVGAWNALWLIADRYVVGGVGVHHHDPRPNTATTPKHDPRFVARCGYRSNGVRMAAHGCAMWVRGAHHTTTIKSPRLTHTTT